nr:hypothetical protein [Tanacetum cinerariifolium]
GQMKLEAQWTADERKATNLDQRLKSLIVPSDVKESRAMDLKLCYNTFKFKESESLTQTFTRYKALMNELLNDGIKLSKLEINTGFINGLLKKWLSFYQSPRNTNHVKDSELASLFDNHDDEKDTRSSHEYLNDLEEEYQERSLLDKSKRFFKNEVSSDDEETKVKYLMTLTKEFLLAKKVPETCINEKIPTQKKKILGIGQLIEDTSSCGSKDLVFIKPSADNSNMSITSSVVFDSLVPDYDLTDESSVCSTPLLPLKKLDGAEPGSGLKTVRSIWKLKSTFKAETLKGITLNEPSSAPARGNKSSSASKTNSAHAGKLKNVNVEDDPPLAMVMKEFNELKLQISKKKSSYSRNKNTQQHHTGQGKSFSRSRPSRPLISFPSCIHCGYNNHHSDDCLYYPTCEIYGSYNHNTHDHNRNISQRRGINPKNPQHVTKNCETCGSNVYTTPDHNDIEWFRKRETHHAKKVESSNALRSKTPSKR